MKSHTYDLELITPCFCAGADQAVAEIRPASIRGQLRWWFRALGGSAANESFIFGSAAGESGSASRVRIAVSHEQIGEAQPMAQFSPNDAVSYIWHYARVSGAGGRGAVGPRWQTSGVLPVGTKFRLHLTQLRDLGNLQKAFDEALLAFLTFGSLGLRATRGLGAFHCTQATDLSKAVDCMEKGSFTVRKRTSPDSFADYQSAMNDWASWLRYRFRSQYKHDRPSPLGGIKPRQASALHFRPIRIADKSFTWYAFEAPGNRVLGMTSRRGAPILSAYNLSGPKPEPPLRPRRY